MLKKISHAAALVAAVLLTGVSAPSQAQAATPRYIFTTFPNSSDRSMSVYTSADALNFKLLKANAYTPPGGILRDPSITKYRGTYYVAYTNATFTQHNTSFGLARSTDLIHWTYLRDVQVPVAGNRYTWAPEWFVDSDGSVNILVSVSTASSGFNLQGYKLTARDPGAFAKWAAPVHLTGLSGNYLDDFIVKTSGQYHDFTSNGSTQGIQQATSTSLTGPYRYTGGSIWNSPRLEGPALLHLPNGTWRMYVDSPWVHKFFYADSTDGLKTFSPLHELPGGLSGVVRHGTVTADS